MPDLYGESQGVISSVGLLEAGGLYKDPSGVALGVPEKRLKGPLLRFGLRNRNMLKGLTRSASL